jgi:HlyD family secretion protein
LKKRIIAMVFVFLFLVAALLVYRGQRQNKKKEIYYSGNIEATQSELSFQVSGRVIEVLLDEGEFVEKGGIMARLDSTEFEARFRQAEANLEAAELNQQRAELALQIAKESLPAEVDRAEAGVRALQWQLNELKAGSRGQDVEQSRLSFLAARVTMVEARKDKERFQKLYQGGIVSEKEYDSALLRFETALREFERAQERWDLMKEGPRKETIQAAQAKLWEGEALLRQAKVNLKRIESAERDVRAAEAQRKAAKAARDLSETQLRYTILSAPFNGIVTSRQVEPGEVISPAREVFTISDLTRVDLKIFVGEREIGKVKPGQEVEVQVDTFPEKVYRGKVAYISPEGEFTPKIIQTQKERVKTVYLVKVSIPNPAIELKSGMPADAWFR